jgi:hypothetical protein
MLKGYFFNWPFAPSRVTVVSRARYALTDSAAKLRQRKSNEAFMAILPNFHDPPNWGAPRYRNPNTARKVD